jgi:hypothetical protein
MTEIGARQDPHERVRQEQREKAEGLLGRKRLDWYDLGELQAAARASGDPALRQRAAERFERAKQAKQRKSPDRPATQGDIDKLLNDWRSDWQKGLDEAFRDAMRD